MNDERVYIGCPCGDEDCHYSAAGHRWCARCERHIHLEEQTPDGECLRHPTQQSSTTGNSLSGEPGSGEQGESLVERLMALAIGWEQDADLQQRIGHPTTAQALRDQAATLEEAATLLTQPKDTHLSGDGERLEGEAKLFAKLLRGCAGEKTDAPINKPVAVQNLHGVADLLEDLATRLSPEASTVKIVRSISGETPGLPLAYVDCEPPISYRQHPEIWEIEEIPVAAARLGLSPENSSGVEEAEVQRALAEIEQARGWITDQGALNALDGPTEFLKGLL